MTGSAYGLQVGSTSATDRSVSAVLAAASIMPLWALAAHGMVGRGLSLEVAMDLAERIMIAHRNHPLTLTTLGGMMAELDRMVAPR